MKSPSACYRDAASPADYSVENGWCHHRVVEKCQECPCTPKDLSFLSRWSLLWLSYMLLQCDLSCPVYCSGNSQVLVRCHHLNVCSLDVHLCAGLSVPAEIHQQLFGLPSVELEVVPLVPVYKVLNKLSVGSVVLILDEADDSRDIRELLQKVVGWLVVEVCNVQGEQEKGQEWSRVLTYCGRSTWRCPLRCQVDGKLEWVHKRTHQRGSWTRLLPIASRWHMTLPSLIKLW